MSARQLLLTFVPALAVLAAVAAVGAFYPVKIGDLTRDMAAVADVHPLTSVVSNLGVLLWCVSASVCAFAAARLRQGAQREECAFLFYAALLSGYILLDDFFMIHERLARWYLGIGPSTITLVLGIAILAHLRRFRAVIARTPFGFLVLALALLGLSVVLDRFPKRWPPVSSEWWFLLEDGCKWLGIASWCSYYVASAHRLLDESRAPGPADART